MSSKAIQRAHRIGQLLGKCPNLLHSYHVGLRAREELEKALLRAGAQAVDVPADDSHSATGPGCSEDRGARFRCHQARGRPSPA